MKDGTDDPGRELSTAATDNRHARRIPLGCQFSLLALLALTLVSALVLAVVRRLNLPVAFKFGAAAYAIVLAAYILLRGLSLVSRARRLRRESHAEREKLAAWLEAKKNAR